MNAGASDRTLHSHTVASSATSLNNRQDTESNTQGRTLANGKALRNTMKDKGTQVAVAKAKEAEKAIDEEAKKSKDAMSMHQTMKLPIDPPGRSPSTFMLPQGRHQVHRKALSSIGFSLEVRHLEASLLLLLFQPHLAPPGRPLEPKQYLHLQ
ncbi:hypothetical protein FRC02_011932 [Tulasnella sp. 418]|nr:hypothetical protein FRC02_011932 [Tulasnella sp. 418]